MAIGSGKAFPWWAWLFPLAGVTLVVAKSFGSAPVGWLVAVLVRPADPRSWQGLVGQIAVEALASAALMLGVSARMPLRCWLALAAWPLVRAAGWVAAWLPLPVTWGEGKAAWRSPMRKSR